MIKKIIKRKPPKGKGHMKIGDTVAFDTGRRLHFGKIVAISKDWKTVTLSWWDGHNYDCSIDCIYPSNMYTPKHHAILLGVKP